MKYNEVLKIHRNSTIFTPNWRKMSIFLAALPRAYFRGYHLCAFQTMIRINKISYLFTLDKLGQLEKTETQRGWKK